LIKGRKKIEIGDSAPQVGKKRKNKVVLKHTSTTALFFPGPTLVP
jgi:hypothetical protein